jgi:Polysaccharide lyase
LALAAALASCEPKLQVGELSCPPSVGGGPGLDADGVFRACVLLSGAAGSAGSGGTSSSGAGGEIAGGVGAAGAGGDGGEVCPAGGALDGPNFGPLPAPWKTGFEAGLCNYEDEAGFCYADKDSRYRVVTSPVHSGTSAVAFDMDPSADGQQRQTRCVRQGVFPTEAYYGAWFYVPSDLTRSGANDWNLFHFQGGMPTSLPQFPLHNLWDVSMDDSAGNGLEAFIYDDVNNEHYGQTDPRPVPTDRWVHLEFYWKRATDATGEVALFQDGEEIVRRSGIVTDDSNFGEWYVGNYTADLTEASATVTVYVDDVTVRLPPP